ncbi:hypothetical protein F9288_09125 [Sphingomonas sp. CL5.1]|uniref:hypothetical protein n=1 Tax=Sphingomonas sp. CL5.1 TaxID=2653203 RepID=UPI0015823144|nr:hypothetical protein [Sphingomonas sp. CL5.1]QKR99781.1 hypothetical protein F9288_09125 [Sphingomonas sp. CL5.1]
MFREQGQALLLISMLAIEAGDPTFRSGPMTIDKDYLARTGERTGDRIDAEAMSNCGLPAIIGAG